MSRLFISPREIQLINDWTKEFIKDVVGQYIMYFPISALKTRIHPIYDEAVEKIFDNPIKIDCLVDQPERGQGIGNWSVENTTELQVYVQARDLIDKGFEPDVGDFFVYGEEVFEILSMNEIGDIFGQAEYNIHWVLRGKLVRSSRFDLPTFKELLEDKKLYQDSNVVKTFEQQRGLAENSEGGTADVRQVRERLSDDFEEVALGEGAREVNVEDEANTSDTDGTKSSSSFYNE